MLHDSALYKFTIDIEIVTVIWTLIEPLAAT